MSFRCNTCLNYRPSRRGRLVQNLSRELQPKSEEVLSKDDRQRQREDDAQSADSEAAREDLWAKEWKSRPHMESYCGVDEHLNRFYVVEIKEPDCQQYEHASFQRTCTTCAFRREPVGRDSDLKQLSNAAGFEAASTSFYQGMLSGSSNRERLAGEQRRSYAIEEALTSATVRSTAAQYFSTCVRMDYEHQGAGERVLCAWANPTNACSYWSGDNSVQSAQTPLAVAASFRLAGFRFEQECEGLATSLRIYAARFTGITPLNLKFRLDWMASNETRSFAGIIAARITVRRLSNAWLYSVYPFGRIGKNDKLIAPSGGYAE